MCLRTSTTERSTNFPVSTCLTKSLFSFYYRCYEENLCTSLKYWIETFIIIAEKMKLSMET
jgi:hypothetical protein